MKCASSLCDALAMYTVNGAFACGQETRCGAIAPGQFADFVVLKVQVGTTGFGLKLQPLILVYQIRGLDDGAAGTGQANKFQLKSDLHLGEAPQSRPFPGSPSGVSVGEMFCSFSARMG